MARTILDSFSQFKSNLEITDYQQDKVAARQRSVRNSLANGHLMIKEDFLTGSYRKNTMVRPMSENDIDMFVVFHQNHANQYWGQDEGHKALIEYVRSTLRRTYTYTNTRADGQALILKFNDGIHVDVVPAFSSTEGHYLIPNLNGTSNTWIHTNPKLHVYWLSENNKNSQGMVVPFIKMVKYWNKANNIGLSSFHIEALVLKHFSGKTINSYATASRSFFSQLANLIDQATPDPVGISGRIDTYLDLITRMGVKIKTINAVKKIPLLPLPNTLLSSFLPNIGTDSTEINTWRSFFGDLFPAYG